MTTGADHVAPPSVERAVTMAPSEVAVFSTSAM